MVQVGMAFGREKEKIMHFKSLDDVTDGNQYLCITSINLIDDSLEMKFYSVK